MLRTHLRGQEPDSFLTLGQGPFLLASLFGGGTARRNALRPARPGWAPARSSLTLGTTPALRASSNTRGWPLCSSPLGRSRSRPKQVAFRADTTIKYIEISLRLVSFQRYLMALAVNSPSLCERGKSSRHKHIPPSLGLPGCYYSYCITLV